MEILIVCFMKIDSIFFYIVFILFIWCKVWIIIVAKISFISMLEDNIYVLAEKKNNNIQLNKIFVYKYTIYFNQRRIYSILHFLCFTENDSSVIL